MFPFSTSNDVADGGFGYSKNHRQPNEAYLFLGMQKAHFLYLFFIELGKSIFTSVHWRNFMPFCAALFHHVVGILLGGAGKQVFRITAWRIIAPMKHPQSFWNRPNANFVGNPVGLVWLSIDRKYAMAIMTSCFFIWLASIFAFGAIYIVPNILFCIGFRHKENARQLESKVLSHSAAIESTGVENRFMAFLKATLMPRKSYTIASNWSTLQPA